MELLTESFAEAAVSDYELERNKPMPNLTHGSLQANFIVQLAINYGSQFWSAVVLDSFSSHESRSRLQRPN